MPAEKSVHVTLKFNVPSDLCERACKERGDQSDYAFGKLCEAAYDTMVTLLESWVRDGSPYGPPEVIVPRDVPAPQPVHTKTVPAVSTTNYEECLSCQ